MPEWLDRTITPVDDGMSTSREQRRQRVSLRVVALLVVGAAAIAMLMTPMAASSAQLVWNMSPSAPAGVYWINRGGWTRGDRVAVRPDDVLRDDLDARRVLPSGKLLIKRVAASAGDTVCRQGSRVSIAGITRAEATVQDSRGRLLPTWDGCRTLGAGEVFLLGDTPSSYDGRYFGVTRSDEVIGRAELLLTF